jgi:anti-anti-sigma regulatory factor
MVVEKWKNTDVLVLRPTPDDLSDPQSVTEILENVLQREGERKILVDLSAATNLTSLQLGSLVTMHLLCYENLAVMKLTNVGDKVKMVLRLIGLDKIMSFHHGPEVVFDSFGPDDVAAKPAGNDPSSRK